MVKNPLADAGDAGEVGLFPGSGRSPGVGNGNPLQYSYLENSMDSGTPWATVYGVAESDTTEHTAHNYCPSLFNSTDFLTLSHCGRCKIENIC